LLCLDKLNVDPVIAFDGDVSNLTRHLKRLHTTEWSADKTKRERAGLPDGANPLGFKPLPPQPVGERTLRKVTIAFSNKQIVRVLVAALVLVHRAPNMLADPVLRLALLMMSGGAFKTPDDETVKRVEEKIYNECTANIAATLVRDGVLNAEGKAMPSVLPRISIGFDASSTQIDGAPRVAQGAAAAERCVRASSGATSWLRVTGERACTA
jgi:hypothetical protein